MKRIFKCKNATLVFDSDAAGYTITKEAVEYRPLRDLTFLKEEISAYLFCAEQLQIVSMHFEDKEDVGLRYKEFCLKQNFIPISDHALSTLIISMHPEVVFDTRPFRGEENRLVYYNLAFIDD